MRDFRFVKAQARRTEIRRYDVMVGFRRIGWVASHQTSTSVPLWSACDRSGRILPGQPFETRASATAALLKGIDT